MSGTYNETLCRADSQFLPISSPLPFKMGWPRACERVRFAACPRVTRRSPSSGSRTASRCPLCSGPTCPLSISTRPSSIFPPSQRLTPATTRASPAIQRPR
uniref:(northern house mosquito) hypothetical protein n=1 Tax=Culex pipiens TaxID=7175 RepID=A0A8D8EU03_CULPI